MRNAYGNSSAMPAGYGNVHLEYGLVGCTAALLAGAVLMLFQGDDGLLAAASKEASSLKRTVAVQDGGSPRLRRTGPNGLASAGKTICMNSMCVTAPEKR